MKVINQIELDRDGWGLSERHNLIEALDLFLFQIAAIMMKFEKLEKKKKKIVFFHLILARRQKFEKKDKNLRFRV